jgi:hypothetical protein
MFIKRLISFRVVGNRISRILINSLSFFIQFSCAFSQTVKIFFFFIINKIVLNFSFTSSYKTHLFIVRINNLAIFIKNLQLKRTFLDLYSVKSIFHNQFFFILFYFVLLTGYPFSVLLHHLIHLVFPAS